MNLKLLEQLGENYPQLDRELKRRLTSRNLLVVAGVAFFSQLSLCLWFASRLPEPAGADRYALWNNTENYWEINWKLWSLDLFITLSLLGILLLLGLGTYQLISDLGRETRQGTLDLIRLSPQPASTILWGKILGVPVLLYGFTALALPLHLASGLAAGISWVAIAGSYLVLGASCVFFYSAALLYTLMSPGLQGWQPAIGTGAVLLGLSAIANLLEIGKETHHVAIARNLWTCVSLLLIAYCLGNHWVWPGLKRRFRRPNTTLSSKTQH